LLVRTWYTGKNEGGRRRAQRRGKKKGRRKGRIGVEEKGEKERQNKRNMIFKKGIIRERKKGEKGGIDVERREEKECNRYNKRRRKKKRIIGKICLLN
jgi:hypothetical protein